MGRCKSARKRSSVTLVGRCRSPCPISVLRCGLAAVACFLLLVSCLLPALHIIAYCCLPYLLHIIIMLELACEEKCCCIRSKPVFVLCCVESWASCLVILTASHCCQKYSRPFGVAAFGLARGLHVPSSYMGSLVERHERSILTYQFGITALT